MNNLILAIGSFSAACGIVIGVFSPYSVSSSIFLISVAVVAGCVAVDLVRKP